MKVVYILYHINKYVSKYVLINIFAILNNKVFCKECLTTNQVPLDANLIFAISINTFIIDELNTSRNIQPSIFKLENSTTTFTSCFFLNDTITRCTLDFAYSYVVINRTGFINDFIHIIAHHSNVDFNNCTLSKLSTITITHSGIIFENSFIEYTEDFDFNQTTKFINTTRIFDFNHNTFDFNQRCYTANKTYNIISGNIEYQVLGTLDTNIKICDAYFENLHTYDNGGAINIERECITCYLNFSSFYYCSAECGGAIYVGPIYRIKLDFICAESCTASFSSFSNFETYSSLGPIYSNYSSLSRFPQNYYGNINVIAFSEKQQLTHRINYFNLSNSFNYKSRGFIISSYIDMGYSSFYNLSTECYIIDCSYDASIFSSSFCYNSILSSYVFFCNKLSLNSTIFYKNQFLYDRLYFTFETYIYDCIIDNISNLTETENFTVIETIPQQYYLPCMMKIEDKKDYTVVIVISVLSSIIGILLIIAFGCFIYTKKIKKIVKIETQKSQLSQAILNDFG